MEPSTTRDGAELPSGVRFEGVAWTDENEDLRHRVDTRLIQGTVVVGPIDERVFAVARYVADDAWRIEVGWAPFLPERGPGELAIYPVDYRNAATDDGIPTSVLRAVPMRHARGALRQAVSRRFVGFRLLEWRVDEYRTDQDWAKLAMACVILAEAGVAHIGATLHEVWPSATAAVWNSRIHRLRRSKGYLVNDEQGRTVLSPEAVRLIADTRGSAS